MVSQQHEYRCSVQDTKPDPEVRNYTFHSCIVAQFAGYFTTVPEGKYLPIKNGMVDQTDSTCGKPNPVLVINFHCGVLRIAFNRDTYHQIYVESITGVFEDKNSTVHFSNTTESFKTSDISHYYECEAEQTLNSTGVTLTLKNMALEVYRNSSSTEFYKIPDKCSLDL